jgi:organic radical activating enzyme
MFDLHAFYDDAHQGRDADINGLLDYLRGFERLYIWGAGNLGSVIGEKLQKLGIPLSGYWDIRADVLVSLCGLSVGMPFHSTAGKDRTGVIVCITSCFTIDRCLSDLTHYGFENMIRGDHLFEALVCEFNDPIRFAACRNATACDVFTCVKNDNYFRRYLGIDNRRDALYFRNITVPINQICTLKCKYCYSHTNAYANDRRINFPVGQILSDIDRMFDAIDGVKIVPLIGGETFLHPELDRIVRKFLEKPNFGILNITTNGIVKIHDRQIESLGSDRIQVVFSNYKTVLSAKECDVFDRNVEKVRAAGAQVKVLAETRYWNIPTTLWDRDYSLEIMKKKHYACRLDPLKCSYVKNGYFYPCPIADSIHNVDVADYPQDRVPLDPAIDTGKTRARIRALLEEREYFHSCRHCEGAGGITGRAVKAGEQGYYEVIRIHPEPSRKIRASAE